MSADQIIIDDDNDSMDIVEILDEDSGNDSKSNNRVIDTKILHEESTIIQVTRSSSINNVDDVEIVEDNSTSDVTEKVFANLLMNNLLMSKLTKLCFSLDSTVAMIRVVNNVLLSLYKNTEKNFKKSNILRKILIKTHKSIKQDPTRKFFHIKTLCDLLRSKEAKKKLPFVTLCKDLTKNRASQAVKDKFLRNQSSYKNRGTNENENKTDVIVLDNLDTADKDFKNEEIKTKGIIIDVTDDMRIDISSMNSNKESNGPTKESNHIISDVLDVTTPEKLDEKLGMNTTTIDSNKENNKFSKESNIIIHDKVVITPIQLNKKITKESDHISSAEIDVNTPLQSDKNLPIFNSENDLLVPLKHTEFKEKNLDIKRIKQIEVAIAHCKQKIELLEKEEVTNHSAFSPYLECDRLKANIVNLYKELCEITGDEPVKRRKVRLQVNKGHHAGPVRKLEGFLNQNIDSSGNTPFPDFQDVVMCVKQANDEDNIGWNKAQIMKEALSLFTQCGNALRERRQKREWRDMMSLIKDDPHDGDPANEDPLLEAKLAENKRIAKMKEYEVLDRFTQMDYLKDFQVPSSPQINNIDLHEASRDSSDLSECSDISTISNNGILKIVGDECDKYVDIFTNNSVICPKIGESVKNKDVHYNTEINSKENSTHAVFTVGESNKIDGMNIDVNDNTRCFLESNSTPIAKKNDLIDIQSDATKTDGEIYERPYDSENNVDNRHNIRDLDKSDAMKIDANKTQKCSQFTESFLLCNEALSDKSPLHSQENADLVEPTTSNCDIVTAVKQEPVDLQVLLEGLGSDYTVTVFDVQDPFLVIEISSDSSSDDDT